MVKLEYAGISFDPMELNSLSMDQMVTIYNSLDATAPVKKFKDRATAHRRLQDALGRIGHPAGMSGHTDAEQTDAGGPAIVDEMEQPAKTVANSEVAIVESPAGEPAAETAAANLTATATPKPKAPDNRIIKVMTPTNPKQVGSKAHARFALYADGDTVDEALAKGVTMADIKNDTKKRFIRLD